ncbi:Uu.00g101520.m01.CDS01 [Anthostomella pinea]|uniref:Uu.00g101520.m01.CDS01 n=1 Tax=Anthostomella pinea TaxID=933095 RepID=A0AAI8YFF4_9PEZI|nr:Uu.00g101520.m01.CDS01 [Anthostomella pinea]
MSDRLEDSMGEQPYPLGASGSADLASVTDDHLMRLFQTAPIIYNINVSKVVRISEHLVLKGGACLTQWEAENQKFAASQGFPVPTVHRMFRGPLENHLEFDMRDEVVTQVAKWIDDMQSKPFNKIQPGPVGGTGDSPWDGPWFTDYGAGPFANLEEMEDWYNHKLDVCHRLRQAFEDIPRFQFEDLVLTHQDIAPRNIVLDEATDKLWLIDWAMSGIYPVGFEQASLSRQCVDEWDVEFREAVLAKLGKRCDREIRQLQGIMYGLTTGAFL